MFHGALNLFARYTSKATDQALYKELLGCLQFLTLIKSPDICFAVSNLALYTSCQSKNHWNALKLIFDNFVGVPNILFGSVHLVLVV